MSARRPARRPFMCPLLAGLLLVAFANAAPAPVRDGASAEMPAVSGQWLLPERAPWAGEVFEIKLWWQVHWPRFNFIDGGVQWPAGAVVVAPWPRPVTEPPEPGSDTGHISMTTQAMALTPGTLTLSPARQQFSLLPGAAGAPGTPPLVRSELVESDKARLDIAALPPAPEQFSGAVGSFSLTSEVSASEVAMGDTLAWTLTLRGTGNWPMRPALPARQLPAALALVEPPALQQTPGASVFEGRLEETMLVTPTVEGRHDLPAVRAVVFDPALGRYVTLTAPARSVRVTPGASWPRDAASEPGPPRWQPIAGAGATWVPPDDLIWFTLLLAPLAGLLLCWLVFSLLHARDADPWRRARRAQLQMQHLIPLLAASSDPEHLRGHLHAWQRLTAQRFFISSAAPTPAALTGEPEWALLWRDADAVLYGAGATLPEDWTERAERLLVRMPLPPRFNPAQALHRSHLLARHSAAAAVLCVMALLTTAQAPGQEAPPIIPGDDWIASYNHAIGLLKDERLNEAAAYAAAAWLRSPADARAHVLWLHTAQSAGFAAQDVLQPTRPLVARVLGPSPALWRWVAVAALCIIALAAGLFLARRFGRAGPSSGTLVILASLGVCGALVSFGLLERYGLAASPDSVVLWRESISRPLPIEQPTDSEAPVLAAGTLARAEKAVLGWMLLRLAAGDRVWVRQTDLVWLWRDTPSSYPNYAKGLKHPTLAESLHPG